MNTPLDTDPDPEYNAVCAVCFKPLPAASARWDGESTYVGFHHCPDHPQAQALNPRLAKAAPELLQALKNISQWLSETYASFGDEGAVEIAEMIGVLVAKAEQRNISTVARRMNSDEVLP